jgi:glutamyl endopeptidase
MICSLGHRECRFAGWLRFHHSEAIMTDPTMPQDEPGATSLIDGGDAEMDLFDVLPDAGAASFPRMSPEAVFHPDDRVRITDTASLPWRVNASLVATARDGSRWVGTGWFITPRTLVTAGHCLFIRGSGVPGRDGWMTSIRVMPGRDEARLPFGSMTSTEFYSSTGWTEGGDQSHDYGVIILPEPFLGDIGVRRFAVRGDDALVGVEAHVAGYPADKPGGTFWHHALPVISAGPRQIFYRIDTAGGQSGAALYVVEDGEPVAVGVHAYGGGVSNSATRITQEVFDDLVRWSV